MRQRHWLRFISQRKRNRKRLACPAAAEEIMLDAASVAVLSAPDDVCALEGVQKSSARGQLF